MAPGLHSRHSRHSRQRSAQQAHQVQQATSGWQQQLCDQRRWRPLPPKLWGWTSAVLAGSNPWQPDRHWHQNCMAVPSCKQQHATASASCCRQLTNMHGSLLAPSFIAAGELAPTPAALLHFLPPCCCHCHNTELQQAEAHKRQQRSDRSPKLRSHSRRTSARRRAGWCQRCARSWGRQCGWAHIPAACAPAPPAF